MQLACSISKLIPLCKNQTSQSAKATATVLVSEAPVNSGIDLTAVDKNMRAQGDFFRPVHGVWLTQTAIPADKSRYGSCNVLYDDNQENLKTFIQKSANTEA